MYNSLTDFYKNISGLIFSLSIYLFSKIYKIYDILDSTKTKNF